MADDALDRAAAHARAWLDGLPERHVGPAGTPALDGPLPEEGTDPAAVIEALAAGAEPGLVASSGPRYFGFVTGGTLPAALAADWLTSAWDQNTMLHSMSPAAAAAERTATELVPRAARPARGNRRRPRARARSSPTSPRSPRRATRSSAAPAGTSRRRASPARRPCA